MNKEKYPECGHEMGKAPDKLKGQFKMEQIEQRQMDRPNTIDTDVWHFKGYITHFHREGELVELLCIPTNNPDGCHEIAHKFYDHWLPTWSVYGAKFIGYDDLHGTWS